MNLVDELHAIASALSAAQIPYAICGGVAVAIYGAPRMTKDIDLLVRREDVAKILEVVRPLGYAFAAIPMVFGAGTPEERHVQRVSKLDGADHLLLDLLVADGAYAGLLDDRIVVDVPDRGPLAVVSKPALVRMKRLAGRAVDFADIERLEGVE